VNVRKHRMRKRPVQFHKQKKLEKLGSGKKNKLPQHFKNKSQLKKIMFAIGSSIFIGIIFGLVTLKMLEQEDPEQTSVLHSTTNDEEKDVQNEQTDKQARTMESFSFYIIQGGVFSDKENANKWGENFQQLDFSAITWAREDDFYVISGVHETKEAAMEAADEMDELGLEAYVKEWKISEGELQLSESEYEWIHSFLEIWNTSLQRVDSEDSISTEAWEELLNNASDISKPLVNIKEGIQTYTAEGNQQSNLKRNQQFLLEIIYEYELLFSETD